MGDYTFETISYGDQTCGIYFPTLYLTRFTSFKIDSAAVCLSFVVNMARLSNFVIIIIILNLCVFLFYVQNEMLCTKHIIVFSLGNSFPLARAQYSNRQHHRKIGHPGKDKNRIIDISVHVSVKCTVSCYRLHDKSSIVA